MPASIHALYGSQENLYFYLWLQAPTVEVAQQLPKHGRHIIILGMGAPELLVILLVTLVIFGPKNLPKLGSALGQTVKSVREGMEESDAAAAEKVKSEVSEASTEAQTAPSQKKSCPKCGAEVDADAAFCSHCGAKID